MKEKLIQFMQGRYGFDALSKFLSASAFFCMILSLFFRRSPFYLFGIVLLVYCYFRTFSRNISARYKENMAYLKYQNRVNRVFRKKKSEMMQRKTHHIYKCPQCRQKIRVPRGRGRIAIRCPKCNTEFIKKS